MRASDAKDSGHSGLITCQDDLQGLWKRVWIRSPSSDPTFEDHLTRVFWAQSGAIYADLRIPLDRAVPDDARCLADLDPPSLQGVMQAEGFAGTISVASGTCTWAREINWHGRPEGIDAGQVWFDNNGDLIEDGIHSDYRELWAGVPLAPLQAERITAGGLTGILLHSDAMFLMGLGRPGAPATGPMLAALEAGAIPVGLPAHFETEYAFGHWNGDRGIADLCTNPFREGHCVLERRDGAWIRHAAGFDGTAREMPVIT